MPEGRLLVVYRFPHGVSKVVLRVRALTRRLDRLEDHYAPADGPRKRFTVVVSALGRPLNLGGSTCRRRLGPDGTMTELVQLDGSRDGLSDEELDRFIERFPIETAT